MSPEGYVVVLEEDPLIRPLLERWLSEAGYLVASPVAAEKARPALVIADVPDPQSAEALVRSLREYAAPILLLSHASGAVSPDPRRLRAGSESRNRCPSYSR